MRKDEELSEFDTLDATERTAMEGALNRCRDLVDKVASELGERKSGDFASILSLADFQASLERAAEVLRTESRQSAKKIKPRDDVGSVLLSSSGAGMPEPTRATRLS